jgi:hypothetical protein
LIDYRVSYDNASGSTSLEVLETSVTATTYTAVGLTQGSYYQFRIEARNLEGLSFYSNTVLVLAA